MQKNESNAISLEQIGQEMAAARGPEVWRSLDQLVDSPSFREHLEREFPRGAAELLDPVSRRNFLKFMGASLALAGLTGCGVKQPQEYVAPFARAPLTQQPGISLYYATALLLDGYATGVLVKNHDGRPTKVEGNPQHPASLGATDIYAQAEILQLYDPDRAQSVFDRGAISTQEAFLAALNEPIVVQRALQGSSLRIVTGPTTSPTMAAQMAALLETYPEAKWIQYAPVGRRNVLEGARLATGEYAEPRYQLREAAVILALDADFLSEGPGHVRYARDFADGRRIRKASAAMNRLYAAEPVLTPTGMIADHRLPLKAAEVENLARAVARGLGLANIQAPSAPVNEAWVAGVVADLQANSGRSLVVVGESQPPIVHAIGHAINQELGNFGSTVDLIDSVIAAPSDSDAALRELATEMAAGEVGLLVMIDVNPVYDAPADLNFAAALANVDLSVLLGLYFDETGRAATWFVPMTHSLESWSDARAFDGTASIVQPLIAPLYNGLNPHELIAILNGQVGTSAYDAVRGYWQEQQGEADFEFFWGAALESGVIANSAFGPRSFTLNTANLGQAATPITSGFEVNLRADPTIYDGRYSNNGWLQELPKPSSKTVWENIAIVGASTAARLLGVNYGDGANAAVDALERISQANGRVVTISVAGQTVNAPLWIVPGHADETVTLTLGYGRRESGRVGNEIGVNGYQLRTEASHWFGGGAQVTLTNEQQLVVSTQDVGTMQGRKLVRSGNFAEYQANPKYIAEAIYEEKYGDPSSPGYQTILEGSYTFPKAKNQWGMTIDLSACIGCNACLVACHAENNIPVVGKEQVGMGREMHWIRIDRYFGGDNIDNPTTYLQPLTCMQCEQAPCEIVCPVAATVHDDEGINNMVYNRCVGTKYCSNNCPYKVRRFNFLQYIDVQTEQYKLMRNPEVSVRNRGVMEKCTYCVQRISAARIVAKREGDRPLRDGEVVTACQQVCPTQAISFGDIADTASAVALTKAEPHNYTLLDELNTKPRTSYLARIRNQNPNIVAGE